MRRSCYPSRESIPGQRDIEVDSYDRFIIYIGGNDISDGVPMKTIQKNLLCLVICLRMKKPFASIVVCGLLPRPREPELAGNLRTLNRWLAKTFNDDYTRYTPVQNRFLRHYQPRLDLYRDGVHLNPKGREVMQSWLVKVARHMP